MKPIRSRGTAEQTENQPEPLAQARLQLASSPFVSRGDNMYLFVQVSLILFSVPSTSNQTPSSDLFYFVPSTNTYTKNISLDTYIPFLIHVEWDVNNFSLRFVAVSLYFSFPEIVTALLHYSSS